MVKVGINKDGQAKHSQMPNGLLGQFVVSKQGRDIDRAYVVVNIVDDNFVWVADGKVRKLDNPKKKRKKHLRIGPKIETIYTKLLDNKKIFDSELYSAINATANTLDPDLNIVK